LLALVRQPPTPENRIAPDNAVQANNPAMGSARSRKFYPCGDARKAVTSMKEIYFSAGNLGASDASNAQS
jgi:hypothetical protein